MKQLKHISPSSLSVWKRSPEEFYLQYLADAAPPRFPQTEAMAIGGIADSAIKALIAKHFDIEYNLEEEASKSVEPQNKHLLSLGSKFADWYIKSGNLSRLLSTIEACRGQWLMEQALADDKENNMPIGYNIKLQASDSIELKVNVDGVDDVIVLKGKPDLAFSPVIFDWKTTGYCSKSGGKTKKFFNGHKSARYSPDIIYDKILVCGDGLSLEHVDREWAYQCCMYGWMQGYQVGSNFIAWIQQILCCNGDILNTADYTFRMSSDFQYTVVKDLWDLWQICKSGYIFREMDEDQSRARQTVLDTQYKAFDSTGLQSGELPNLDGRVV